jgi:hypothetical protein
MELRYNLNCSNTIRDKGYHAFDLMIIYDLICEQGHRFEGWFKSATDFTQQEIDGMLSCPTCGANQVSKLPTASRIRTHRDHEDPPLTQLAAEAGEALLESIQRFVDENYDDVGNAFPEEARKIHYGEVEARNIHGTASPDDIRALNEEGVGAIPLPGRPFSKDKLN